MKKKTTALYPDPEGEDIVLNLGLDPNLPGVREAYRRLLRLLANCEVEDVDQGRAMIVRELRRDFGIRLDRKPPKSDKGTTNVGYVNRNDQEVVRPTGLSGSDHMQYVYVLRCRRCATEYGASGSDIFQRRCPSCQGGRPGLSIG